MSTKAFGWAAMETKKPLVPFEFQRDQVKEGDVSIKIKFCGVCHSDLHQVRDEWGKGTFPMVPGHEIVGHVTAVGSKVTKFKVGDAVGVGCMVDSCLSCRQCTRDLEQHCQNRTSFTYNSLTQDGKPTYGGYSDHIVVREHFVLRIPANLDLCAAAPLLCAGITTFSPLRQWGVTKGTRVGVVGLGGLGHMAIQLANAMGAEVTLFSRSQNKITAAKELGAKRFIISSDAEAMEKATKTLDLIINTISSKHDLSTYIKCLDIGGKMVMVGMSEELHPPLDVNSMVSNRKALAGSLIGGIAETQEMLDFCGKHNITAIVEKINIDYINEAYERLQKSDVVYRFVIDMSSLKTS